EGARGSVGLPVAVADDEGVEGVTRAGRHRADGEARACGRHTEPHRVALAERVGQSLLDRGEEVTWQAVARERSGRGEGEAVGRTDREQRRELDGDGGLAH